MPLLLQARDTDLAGDTARRRASISLILSLMATPVSIWLFTNIEPLWTRILALEGSAFMLGATALGGVLAVAPLVAGIGFLLAIWFGVESVYLPRQHRSPLIDKCIIGSGLLVWFSPVLAALGSAARGLFEGRVHFVRPPRDYFLATDPIAFWQGIGFWLIMAALFGFLAWRYWRNKLLAAKA
ncbi:MAG: hypothetical protein Q7J47_09060 [Azoarcus sp.]|nr:hypothetical protein [Azoarcus sp.]